MVFINIFSCLTCYLYIKLRHKRNMYTFHTREGGIYEKGGSTGSRA